MTRIFYANLLSEHHHYPTSYISSAFPLVSFLLVLLVRCRDMEVLTLNSPLPLANLLVELLYVASSLPLRICWVRTDKYPLEVTIRMS